MKSRSDFKFRQFSVSDDRCSMKVGTDAVLLAAWADLRDAQRILDIGTGSGVIALIAAQRTNTVCRIDGIEIQAIDCAQAAENAAASPWTDRVNIICTAVQDYDPPYRYDAILCNPPYFINSLRPPADGRTTARHTVSLDHDMLVASVNRLLSSAGTASFIMPPDEANQFMDLMEVAGLRATRICSFRTRAAKPVERLLMTFARPTSAAQATLPTSDDYRIMKSKFGELAEILLYADGNRWTKEYTDLTQDLYMLRP